jgi:hypothetical protein
MFRFTPRNPQSQLCCLLPLNQTSTPKHGRHKDWAHHLPNPHLLFSVSVSSCFDSHQETHKASCASDKNHTSCTWLGGLCGCRLESAFLRPIRRHGAVTDRSEFLGSLWNLRRSAEVKFLEMRKTIDNSTMGICSKIKPKGTTIFVYIYDIAWLYHMIL